MRISSNSEYLTAMANIERAANDLARWQAQVSSGRRLQVPERRPLATTQAIAEHAELGTLDQYVQTADSAKTRLTVVDTVLSDVLDRLTSARASARPRAAAWRPTPSAGRSPPSSKASRTRSCRHQHELPGYLRVRGFGDADHALCHAGGRIRLRLSGRRQQRGPRRRPGAIGAGRVRRPDTRARLRHRGRVRLHREPRHGHPKQRSDRDCRGLRASTARLTARWRSRAASAWTSAISRTTGQAEDAKPASLERVSTPRMRTWPGGDRHGQGRHGVPGGARGHRRPVAPHAAGLPP